MAPTHELSPLRMMVTCGAVTRRSAVTFAVTWSSYPHAQTGGAAQLRAGITHPSMTDAELMTLITSIMMSIIMVLIIMVLMQRALRHAAARARSLWRAGLSAKAPA